MLMQVRVVTEHPRYPPSFLAFTCLRWKYSNLEEETTTTSNSEQSHPPLDDPIDVVILLHSSIFAKPP